MGSWECGARVSACNLVARGVSNDSDGRCRGARFEVAVQPVAHGASQVAQSAHFLQQQFEGAAWVADVVATAPCMFCADAATLDELCWHGGAPNAAAVAGSGIEIARKTISMVRSSCITL